MMGRQGLNMQYCNVYKEPHYYNIKSAVQCPGLYVLPTAPPYLMMPTKIWTKITRICKKESYRNVYAMYF